MGNAFDDDSLEEKNTGGGGKGKATFLRKKQPYVNAPTPCAFLEFIVLPSKA